MFRRLPVGEFLKNAILLSVYPALLHKEFKEQSLIFSNQAMKKDQSEKKVYGLSENEKVVLQCFSK